ncbi:MAG: 30S ribosomal protein S12 methylthiotransferase RimO [Bacilli bacterium]|nr:30S ribosomal protein S12 methylthiotransferase RimO [Bacilli bacterium]
MKKVGMVSLGCHKNLVDSENILGLFDRNEYEITNDPADADVIVVNTCGFIESSKKESIENILDMLSYEKKVVVTGCLAQRYLEDLKKEIPEVDVYIPISEYQHFNKHLSTIDKDIDPSLGLDDEYRIVSTGPFSAFLKIGEGCDNCCTYCAIPLIRGHFVSRPYKEIIKEAKDLADNGIKEIIILEQDTTKYGIDLKEDKKDIVGLLKELLKIEKLDYIRLLYLYPDEISDELIDLIAKEKRLTPYFDVPIQHSEDHILKDMHRRGDKDFLRNLFKKIREKVPNAVLRTTVMVGFPGETEEDVDNLIKFMQEVKFDHLGSFTYSREEDTPSFDYPNQIDEEVKKERMNKVMRAQRKISYQLNKGHLDEVMEGLIIGKEGDTYLLRNYWNAPDDVDGKIFVTSSRPLMVGEKVKVKINDAFIYDLMGELLD